MQILPDFAVISLFETIVSKSEMVFFWKNYKSRPAIKNCWCATKLHRLLFWGIRTSGGIFSAYSCWKYAKSRVCPLVREGKAPVGGPPAIFSFAGRVTTPARPPGRRLTARAGTAKTVAKVKQLQKVKCFFFWKNYKSRPAIFSFAGRVTTPARPVRRAGS